MLVPSIRTDIRILALPKYSFLSFGAIIALASYGVKFFKKVPSKFIGKLRFPHSSYRLILNFITLMII